MKTIKGSEINIDKLATGDRVDCSGGKFDPVSCSIRAKSAGYKRMFDHKKVATHTGTILEVNGVPMMVEMYPKPGTEYDCRISPLFERDGKIISIYRYKALWGEAPLGLIKGDISMSGNTDEIALAAREMLAHDLTRDANDMIPYDWDGLFEFISDRFEDNPRENYCSEHHTARLRAYENELYQFVKKVSPFDLQIFSVRNVGRLVEKVA